MSSAPTMCAGEGTQSQGDLHVHFSSALEEQLDVEGSVRQVEVVCSEGQVHINVGFLKELHQYRVVCPLPFSCAGWRTGTAENPHWMVREMRDLGPHQSEVTLQVTTLKENLLREKLTLSKDDPDNKLVLEIHATILGENTGTPVLREGVHLEASLRDDVEGASDSSGRKGLVINAAI